MSLLSSHEHLYPRPGLPRVIGVALWIKSGSQGHEAVLQAAPSNAGAEKVCSDNQAHVSVQSFGVEFSSRGGALPGPLECRALDP